MHVVFYLFFAKIYFLIFSYFVKNRTALNIFHHQVDVLRVLVSLVVFDYVRMIKFVQNWNFLKEIIWIFKFLLFHNLDGHFDWLVIYVFCLVNFTKRATTN